MTRKMHMHMHRSLFFQGRVPAHAHEDEPEQRDREQHAPVHEHLVPQLAALDGAYHAVGDAQGARDVEHLALDALERGALLAERAEHRDGVARQVVDLGVPGGWNAATQLTVASRSEKRALLRCGARVAVALLGRGAEGRRAQALSAPRAAGGPG